MDAVHSHLGGTHSYFKKKNRNTQAASLSRIQTQALQTLVITYGLFPEAYYLGMKCGAL